MQLPFAAGTIQIALASLAEDNRTRTTRAIAPAARCSPCLAGTLDSRCWSVPQPAGPIPPRSPVRLGTILGSALLGALKRWIGGGAEERSGGRPELFRNGRCDLGCAGENGCNRCGKVRRHLPQAPPHRLGCLCPGPRPWRGWSAIHGSSRRWKSASLGSAPKMCRRFSSSAPDRRALCQRRLSERLVVDDAGRLTSDARLRECHLALQGHLVLRHIHGAIASHTAHLCFTVHAVHGVATTRGGGRSPVSWPQCMGWPQLMAVAAAQSGGRSVWGGRRSSWGGCRTWGGHSPSDGCRGPWGAATTMGWPHSMVATTCVWGWPARWLPGTPASAMPPWPAGCGSVPRGGCRRKLWGPCLCAEDARNSITACAHGVASFLCTHGEGSAPPPGALTDRCDRRPARPTSRPVRQARARQGLCGLHQSPRAVELIEPLCWDSPGVLFCFVSLFVYVCACECACVRVHVHVRAGVTVRVPVCACACASECACGCL